MQRLRYSPYFKSIFAVIDQVVLLSTIVWYTGTEGFWHEENLFTMLLVSLFWFLLSSKTRIYNIPRTLTYTSYLERLVIHLLLFNLGAALIAKITKSPALTFANPRVLVTFSLLIFLVKTLIFTVLKWIRIRGYNYRNIMFISTSGASALLRETLSKRRDYGYRIYDYPLPLDVALLKNFWAEKLIHTVYIPLQHQYSETFINDVIREAERAGVRISVVPDILTDQFATYHLSYAESQPVLEKSKLPLEMLGNFTLKRGFDILFSLLFLALVATWLFPIIALMIKSEGKGKILFKQKRLGYKDLPFSCLKFRTMVENADSLTKTTEKNDLRITRTGRFLRRTSLDETPQFINVLMGDMSVVGPRPHMVAVDRHYRSIIERYSVRNTVRPGITGLAQISGLRGEQGNMENHMQKRILADAFYVRNWSFSLDAIIIIKTVYLLLRGDKSAY